MPTEKVLELYEGYERRNPFTCDYSGIIEAKLLEAKDIDKDDINALMQEIQILRIYINVNEKDQLESSMDKEDISQLKKVLLKATNDWGSPSAKQTTST